MRQSNAVIMRELAQQRAQTRHDEDRKIFNALCAFEQVTLTQLRVAMALGSHRDSWLKTRLAAFVRRGAAVSWLDDEKRRQYRASDRGAL